MGKKLGIAAAILSVLSLSIGFYLWRQFTKVPEWYSDTPNPALQQIDANRLPELQAARQQVYTKIDKQIRQKPSNADATVKLTEAEINDVIVANLVESFAGTDILNATRGINTTIDNETIEIGMVVNTANLNLEGASAEGQAAASQILTQFPLLKDRDIYIGLASQPKVVDGQLILDDDTRVKVGSLSFTLADIAKRTGISKAELLREANLALRDLNIGDLQLENGELMVKRARP